ncbi:MAG: ferrous iron transport protein A [Candidatus Aminicenantes bacterium]|nr:ferrous iron transport protein A [Candidatus Aminicenantes bacterium]
MISLIDAPSDTPLRIVDIHGGHGFRRRFFALGFHKNNLIELDSKSIMRGPVLVRNISNGTSLAIGRGVAQKIWVEIVGEQK